MEADERAIRAVHASWIEAVNAGDLEPLLGMMAEDVVFLSPGQPPFGPDGFRAGFSGGHRAFRLRCVSELQEVTVAGDIAYTLCKDSLSLTPRGGGGAAEELAGHRITIYRKQPDGSWRLARDAHTLAPVAG
jgi:uncharacterized protein (TIGR02246 family)